jgi:phage terminase small subunit
MALSDKRLRFAQEYCKCWNSTEAARRAGYSKETADTKGPLLRKDPEIDTYIQDRVTQNAMSSDEALYHVGQIARGEWAAAFNVDTSGYLISFDPKKAEELGLMNLIQEFAPIPNSRGYKFKFPSRMDALKTILTALGVLKGDVSDADIGRFLAGLTGQGEAKDRPNGGEAG